LVRSKSFTEQETLANTSNEDRDKYHTVATRDATKFQGIRDKIAQWNSDLKKRKSTENFSHFYTAEEKHFVDKDRANNPLFITAFPQQGQVKSSIIVNYASLKHRPRSEAVVAWSSPNPSPPISDISSDSSPEHNQCDSYRFQDEDSGYDGYCQENSIYSTTASDSSSIVSSEPEAYLPMVSSLYGKAVVRPRPRPICEKDRGSSDTSFSRYWPPSPRSKVTEATVINLDTSQLTHCDSSLEPPPLPPRPSTHPSMPSLPPVCKPSLGLIRQGAVSLPRQKPDWQDRARTNELHIATICQQETTQNQNEKVLLSIFYGLQNFWTEPISS
jgi:hypothetical protein